MAERNTVTVVVCAHSNKRADLLRAALNSLLAQTAKPDEIIAVIDHNESLQAKITSEFPKIRTMANRGQQGLSDARNTAITEAKGDIIAFIDDDAKAEPDWLAKLCRHYDSPHVMGVGGKIVPAWPNDRPSWFPEEFDWIVGCTHRGQPTELSEVRNLIGCNMSFRRAIFARAGLFSVQLGRAGNDAAGCEETELCIRAKQAFPRSQILYDPEASVQHFISLDRTKKAYFRTRCRAEGRSKASVVAHAGSDDGLSSERHYATRVLPAGFFRGLGQSIASLEPTGAHKAWMIASGLFEVSFSYFAKRLNPRVQHPAATKSPSFAPIRVLELELNEPVSGISAIDAETGVPYGGVFALVRRNRQPIGVVEFPLYGEDISAKRAEELFRRGLAETNPVHIEASDKLPFVRVVIATRERPETLRRCLDSLLVQDYPSFEIVVVDNAPTSDATRRLLDKEYEKESRVRYLLEPRAGLGHAHNRGLAELNARVVAFTDDDVIVDADWLRRIAANFVADPKIGCVTGMILPAELDTRAQYWTERHGSFGKGFFRRLFDFEENRPDDVMFPYAAGKFGSGANMSFSSDALRAMGGFNSALGAGTLAKGGDDLAAFLAVLKAGYRLAYEPGAIVWHHHRRSEQGMQNQAYGYGVGLGAYLTSAITKDPLALLHFLRALPWAARHMLGSKSSKNSRLPSDYPKGLFWRERLALLAGVVGYFRSSASLRRYRRRNSNMNLTSRHLSSKVVDDRS